MRLSAPTPVQIPPSRPFEVTKKTILNVVSNADRGKNASAQRRKSRRISSTRKMPRKMPLKVQGTRQPTPLGGHIVHHCKKHAKNAPFQISVRKKRCTATHKHNIQRVKIPALTVTIRDFQNFFHTFFHVIQSKVCNVSTKILACKRRTIGYIRALQNAPFLQKTLVPALDKAQYKPAPGRTVTQPLCHSPAPCVRTAF